MERGLIARKDELAADTVVTVLRAGFGSRCLRPAVGSAAKAMSAGKRLANSVNNSGPQYKTLCSK